MSGRLLRKLLVPLPLALTGNNKPRRILRTLSTSRPSGPPKTIPFQQLSLLSSKTKVTAIHTSLGNVYQNWIEVFQNQNISEPDASAEFIIAYVLGKETFSGLDMRQPVTSLQMNKIDELCSKRLTKMPIQYVLGEWNFDDMMLKMKPPVFIPRPETQGLVDLVADELNLSFFDQIHLLEVGCGSGAISLALLHACNMGKIKKQLKITAIDRNIDAIHLAQRNAEIIDTNKFELFHCDVTSLPSGLTFDGIVSNPPYIPTKEITRLAPEISEFESHLALDGGEDGLDVIRDIVHVAENVVPVQGWIWLEVDTSHPKILENLFENFQLADIKQDFLGKNRFVKLVKTS